MRGLDRFWGAEDQGVMRRNPVPVSLGVRSGLIPSRLVDMLRKKDSEEAVSRRSHDEVEDGEQRHCDKSDKQGRMPHVSARTSERRIGPVAGTDAPPQEALPG